MSSEKHGRQYGTTLDEIEPGHKERYKWVAKQLTNGNTVMDAGCGVGYGTMLMATMASNVSVLGIDQSERAIEIAQDNYGMPEIGGPSEWEFTNADLGDFDKSRDTKNMLDAVVCFEVIEHVDNPSGLLDTFRHLAPTLYCSVPNELVVPFEKTKPLGHVRHYTPTEFLQLFKLVDPKSEAQLFTQKEKYSPVDELGDFFSNESFGRTIVAKVTWSQG